jgi:hypothetical protein
MTSPIDKIDIDEILIHFQNNFLPLTENKINIEGRELVENTPIEHLTTSLMEAFYTKHHENFRSYPFRSLAMISAEHLTPERLAVIKKYDLPGLANFHYPVLTPEEYAQGIKFNLNEVVNSANKIREADYLLNVINICMKHHGYDTDYKLVAGAADRRKQHWAFCEFVVKLKGIETMAPLVRTPAQRRMLIQVFGMESVSRVIKLNAKEKRNSLSDDFGL